MQQIQRSCPSVLPVSLPSKLKNMCLLVFRHGEKFSLRTYPLWRFAKADTLGPASLDARKKRYPPYLTDSPAAVPPGGSFAARVSTRWALRAPGTPRGPTLRR